MKVFKRLKTTRSLALDARGFTLTEMLIVIALIALVGTFVTSNIIARFNEGKVKATKIQIKQLGAVLDDYRRVCGRYPTTDQGLDALVNKPSAPPECKNWGPESFVKKVPKDGFDNDFAYESDGSIMKITSLGNDNAAGGEGIDKDITSNDAE